MIKKMEFRKPRRNQKAEILIHTCCADCLLNSINYISKNKVVEAGESIVVFFYNPNIHPRSEYLERLKALKSVIGQIEEYRIELVIPNYSPKEYFTSVVKQGERTCKKCWELRLLQAFKYAKENGINIVTTTLLTSHYQGVNAIFEIGKSMQNDFGIQFLKIDNTENCKNHGFYKQNYCGCCFSLVEKMST